MTAASTGALVVAAHQQAALNRRTWRLSYATMMFVSVVLGLLFVKTSPAPMVLPLTMLMIVVVAALARPVVGIYLLAFFTFLGDSVTAPWYPFRQNMSSLSSMLFISNALIISPLEVVIGAVLAAFAIQRAIARDRPLVVGGLLKPLAVFVGFVLIGLMYGIARGGDRYVALWEVRPLFYLPALYIVITNVFTTRRQYVTLMWCAGLGTFGQSVIALKRYFSMLPEERERLESLTEHSASVMINVFIVMLIGAFLIRRTHWARKMILPVLAIPVVWAYMLSQRRAAFIALGVALLLVAAVLSKVNPRALKRVGPIALVVAVAYIGAFWNSESTTGFPAQAVKSVVAPDQLSEKDQSSDLYRVIENYDLVSTIKSTPLTGVGFGQKFYRPIPLPDISFFPFYEYIPHNSILWIWLKVGVFGFVAMLFLMASAIREGIRTTLTLRGGDGALLGLAATCYVVMFLVFAYVDIAWADSTMVLMAVSMAICSELTRLPADDPSRPPAQIGGR